MSTYQTDAISMIDALHELAMMAEVKDAYWIVTPDGEYISDSGNEWCFDCGIAKTKSLRKHDRKRAREYILDGGWVSEHDTPPHCAHCGVKLRASLRFYGGIYELDHFRNNPPTPGNVDHAYEVSEMLSALQYADTEYDELVKEAIMIAGTVIADQEGMAP